MASLSSSLRDWKDRNLSWVPRRLPISATIGTLGAIFGFLGGAAGLLDSFKANNSVREWVLSVVLGLTSIFALAGLARREIQLGRHSRYVATLHQQEEASELLRDLRIFLRRFGSVEPPTREVLARARKMIEEILGIYAQIYSSLTSTRCRTCVKLVNVSKGQQTPSTPDDLIVYTLARDATSASEERENDQKRLREELDKLKDNSDFVSLFNPRAGDDGFFRSDDLSKELNYSSSSLNFRMNVAADPNKSKPLGWQLWYKSTIVWPIRRDAREELDITEAVCLGFVTVDSHVPGVFLADEHGPLGKMLANALYPIIDQYIQLDAMIASRQEGNR